MKLHAALTKEQGVTFAVVVVKSHVLANKQECASSTIAFSRYFPGVPIILMAQDVRGRPTYYGRPDIVRFLARVPMQALPWKEYTFARAA